MRCPAGQAARGLALLLLLPAGAGAQEAPPKGMPQLDFANPLTVSQIVWLVVIFLAMYATLSSWALPKVGAVVGRRAARIAHDLDGARAAKAEADTAVREVRDTTARARAEAQDQIDQAVNAARREASGKAAVLDAELEARLAESDRRIAKARAAALAGLHEVAVDAANAVIERLSGRAPAAHAVDAAVGELLARRAA